MEKKMEQQVQRKIQNLEFDMKANSFYLSKNPEIKERVESQLSKLKQEATAFCS